MKKGSCSYWSRNGYRPGNRPGACQERVHGLCQRQERRKLKETLEEGKDLDIRPLIFDVRDVRAVEAGLSELDKIDCLVNNAGRSIRKKKIEDITEDDWDPIMETNARGYFFVMKYALKKWIGAHAS